MTPETLKERVIADGLAEVHKVYAEGDPKREGAVEGFELCRVLRTREEFWSVLQARYKRERRLRRGPSDRYWYHRYATLQIEWVMNCMMVAFWSCPGDVLSGRAARKVAEVFSEMTS